MFMKRDLLLVLGILLSTASQLRPAGASIGPGEVCLMIWIALMLGREPLQLGPRFTPALSRLVLFWLLFGVAQSIGTLAGFAIADVHDTSLFMHDVMAYPLLAAISLLCVVGPDAASRLHRVAWLLVALGSAILAPQVGQAWGWLSIGSIDPWYWDRLRGLSENPNQLAILCAVLGLLSLHLVDVAGSAPARIAAIGAAVLPVYVGRLTKSDTCGIVIVAAGPIFIVLKLRTWLLHQPRLTVHAAFAWMVIFALPLLLVSAVPIAHSIGGNVEALAQGMAKGDQNDTENTARIRFEAWAQAFDRGLDSGMLGLGPGPHLPIPATILAERDDPTEEPKYLEHPENNGTPNFEAHNTLLDIFTQGGLLAALTLVWLVGSAFLLTFRARLDGLTTLLCGLTLFMIFHLIVRHPVFWLAIAMCLVTPETRKVSLMPARS
jgi:O-antigen ligase/polysaccharide polymerase Wzy-like membrane protein